MVPLMVPVVHLLRPNSVLYYDDLEGTNEGPLICCEGSFGFFNFFHCDTYMSYIQLSLNSFQVRVLSLKVSTRFVFYFSCCKIYKLLRSLEAKLCGTVCHQLEVPATYNTTWRQTYREQEHYKNRTTCGDWEQADSIPSQHPLRPIFFPTARKKKFSFASFLCNIMRLSLQIAAYELLTCVRFSSSSQAVTICRTSKETEAADFCINGSIKRAT